MSSYKHNFFLIAFYKQAPLLSPQNIIVVIGIVLVSIIIDKRSDGALVIYILGLSGESLLYAWSTMIPSYLSLFEAEIS